MIDLPPPRFDHPFIGPPVIEFVVPDVDEKCRRGGTAADASAIVLGCSFKIGDRCFIFLKQRHPLLDQLRRHEIAHCNGWTKAHEP